MAKKPSVDRSVLSWTFTPSSVMLIVPRGRPLIVELRLPPAVATPGSIGTKSIALRLVSGSFVIWFVSMVVVIVALCVCTIADDDTTLIDSSTAPSCSTARTLAPVPDVRTTPSATKVLKPCSVTVTV